MKIVLAIDSFKGCLTSEEAERAAAEGLKDHEVVALPVSDGGEGMLAAFSRAMNAEIVSCKAHDALMRETVCEYAIKGQTAIIEMAAACGLIQIPVDKRNPWITTTYGLGEMIKDAYERGCRDFIIGLGGSATSDAGVGMLQALGVKITDKQGRDVARGAQGLAEIANIDTTDSLLRDVKVTVASDVENPLYGKQGAAFVFAGQKGADFQMIMDIDAGLKVFAEKVNAAKGVDVNPMKGAGAAGGVGAALLGFCDATFRSGAELLLELLDFEQIVKDADLIITGEGSSDKQTLMGKLPCRILQHSQGVPVYLIAGQIHDAPKLLKAGFKKAVCINPPFQLYEESMKPDVARENIIETMKRIVDM